MQFNSYSIQLVTKKGLHQMANNLMRLNLLAENWNLCWRLTLSAADALKN